MPTESHDAAHGSDIRPSTFCPICHVYDCETAPDGSHNWMTMRAIRHLRARYPAEFRLEFGMVPDPPTS